VTAGSWSSTSSWPRPTRPARLRWTGLRPLQRKDFEEILEAMDNLPVTIRLLDPPLHEFLPNIVDMTAKMAVAEDGGRAATEADEEDVCRSERLHEPTRCWVLRGVRLGLVIPGLFEMQVRRPCWRPTAAAQGQGKNPAPSRS
jgi:pyruvate,orthophosphate dikinase